MGNLGISLLVNVSHIIMKTQLISLFQDTWAILRQNKMIWIFSFLFVFPKVISLFLQSDEIALYCLNATVNLLGFAIMVISLIGIIRVVFSATKSEIITFSEAWREAKRYFWRVFSTYLVFGVTVLILLLLFFPYTQFAEASLLAYIALVLVSQIAWPMALFAWCGIVIDKLKVFQSLRNSLLITVNNISQVLVIDLIFLLAYYLFIGISVLVAWLLPGNQTLLEPMSSFSMRSLIALDRIPAIWLLNRINLFIFTALGSTIYTLAYLRYTAKISYPDLDLSRRQSTG